MYAVAEGGGEPRRRRGGGNRLPLVRRKKPTGTALAPGETGSGIRTARLSISSCGGGEWACELARGRSGGSRGDVLRRRTR